MSYVNAALTPRARLRVAQLVVDQRVPISEVAARAITVEHVLSDNGSPYVSTLWAQVCHQLGLVHKRTRPRRPQTNGKIERFHRTMADGWAYARCYTSEQQRRDALAGWIHLYNHHRPHPASSNHPPITRLTTPPRSVQLDATARPARDTVRSGQHVVQQDTTRA